MESLSLIMNAEEQPFTAIVLRGIASVGTDPRVLQITSHD